MLPYILQFTATLLLVGTFLRWLETNYPEQGWAKALMYSY